jgi:hypothetical protein
MLNLRFYQNILYNLLKRRKKRRFWISLIPHRRDWTRLDTIGLGYKKSTGLLSIIYRPGNLRFVLIANIRLRK